MLFAVYAPPRRVVATRGAGARVLQRRRGAARQRRYRRARAVGERQQAQRCMRAHEAVSAVYAFFVVGGALKARGCQRRCGAALP